MSSRRPRLFFFFGFLAFFALRPCLPALAGISLLRRTLLGGTLLGRTLLGGALLGRTLLGGALLGRTLLRRALLRRALLCRALLGRALLGRALLGGIGSGPLRARGARRRGKQLQEATPPLCTGDYEGLDGRARKMFRAPQEKREGPPSEPSRKRAGVRPLSKAARRRARCHRA